MTLIDISLEVFSKYNVTTKSFLEIWLFLYNKFRELCESFLLIQHWKTFIPSNWNFNNSAAGPARAVINPSVPFPSLTFTMQRNVSRELWSFVGVRGGFGGRWWEKQTERCLQFAMFGVSGAAGPGWIVIWLLLEIFPTVEIFPKSTCCNKEGWLYKVLPVQWPVSSALLPHNKHSPERERCSLCLQEPQSVSTVVSRTVNTGERQEPNCQTQWTEIS